MNYLRFFTEWVDKYAFVLMFVFAFSAYIAALHNSALNTLGKPASTFGQWLAKTLCIFIAIAGFAFLMSLWSNLPS